MLAQNGDGLRADQAGAADDDDPYGLPSLVDDSKLQPWGKISLDSRANANTEAVGLVQLKSQRLGALLTYSLTRLLPSGAVHPDTTSRAIAP